MPGIATFDAKAIMRVVIAPQPVATMTPANKSLDG